MSPVVTGDKYTEPGPTYNGLFSLHHNVFTVYNTNVEVYNANYILIKRSFAPFRFFHILCDILTNNFKPSFLNLHSLKEFYNVYDKTKIRCGNDFRKN